MFVPLSGRSIAGKCCVYMHTQKEGKIKQHDEIKKVLKKSKTGDVYQMEWWCSGNMIARHVIGTHKNKWYLCVRGLHNSNFKLIKPRLEALSFFLNAHVRSIYSMLPGVDCVLSEERGSDSMYKWVDVNRAVSSRSHRRDRTSRIQGMDRSSTASASLQHDSDNLSYATVIRNLARYGNALTGRWYTGIDNSNEEGTDGA